MLQIDYDKTEIVSFINLIVRLHLRYFVAIKMQSLVNSKRFHVNASKLIEKYFLDLRNMFLS